MFNLIGGSEYPIHDPERPTDPMLLQGTVPPVTQFSNTFSSKTIEEVAAWLQHGPDSMYLERKLLAVLDDHSEPSNTITVCQRNPERADHSFYGENEYGELKFFPERALHTGVLFAAIPGGYEFDSALESYKMRQANTPGADSDLSRGRPYWRGLTDDRSNNGPNVDEEESEEEYEEWYLEEYRQLKLQERVAQDADDEAGN